MERPVVGPLGKSPGFEVSYPVARHKSEKPPDDSCSQLFASFLGIQVFPPETPETETSHSFRVLSKFLMYRICEKNKMVVDLCH